MHPVTEPEDFVIRFAHLVPAESDVLDVAAGTGRHSLVFAKRGCNVLAIERAPELVLGLKKLGIAAAEGDVERFVLLSHRFDAVINTFFLYRPILPQYLATLRPNGTLFFRTYTTAHMDALGNRSPRREHLLEPGELKAAFAGLSVVHYSEEVQDGRRAIATIVARKSPVMPE